MTSEDTKKKESELAFDAAVAITSAATYDKTAEEAFEYFVKLHSKFKDYFNAYHEMVYDMNAS